MSNASLENKQAIKPNYRGRVVFAILVAGAAFYFWHSSRPHFTEADITTVKTKLRELYEKEDGISVNDVTIIRESDTKLVGFLKYSAKGFDREWTVNCSAQLGDDGNYIMGCKP